jgi:hypothetical protein
LANEKTPSKMNMASYRMKAVGSSASLVSFSRRRHQDQLHYAEEKRERVLRNNSCPACGSSSFRSGTHPSSARTPTAVTPTPTNPQPSTIDQLKQLGELRDSGVLTPEEFEQQKQQVLAGQAGPSPTPPSGFAPGPVKSKSLSDEIGMALTSAGKQAAKLTASKAADARSRASDARAARRAKKESERSGAKKTVATPAGWYPDPVRRFEFRYWDGKQWTEHVSTAGESSTDPLAGTPADLTDEPG